MLSDPRQVALALAPAGSGKTTATRTLASVCDDLGYTTIGLAPSAAAAAVLREATGMPTETLAKVDHLLTQGKEVGIGASTVVVIPRHHAVTFYPALAASLVNVAVFVVALVTRSPGKLPRR